MELNTGLSGEPKVLLNTEILDFENSQLSLIVNPQDEVVIYPDLDEISPTEECTEWPSSTTVVGGDVDLYVDGLCTETVLESGNIQWRENDFELIIPSQGSIELVEGGEFTLPASPDLMSRIDLDEIAEFPVPADTGGAILNPPAQDLEPIVVATFEPAPTPTPVTTPSPIPNEPDQNEAGAATTEIETTDKGNSSGGGSLGMMFLSMLLIRSFLSRRFTAH